MRLRPITSLYCAQAAFAAAALCAIYISEHQAEKSALWQKANTAPVSGEKPCRVHLGKSPDTVLLTDTKNGKSIEIEYKVKQGRYTLVSPYFHPEMSEQQMLDRKEQLSSPALVRKISAAACDIAARDGSGIRTLQEQVVARRFYQLNCR